MTRPRRPLDELKERLPVRASVHWGDAWVGVCEKSKEPHLSCTTGVLLEITDKAFVMGMDPRPPAGVESNDARCIIPPGWVFKVEVLGVSETVDFAVKVSAKRRRKNA